MMVYYYKKVWLIYYSVVFSYLLHVPYVFLLQQEMYIAL